MNTDLDRMFTAAAFLTLVLAGCTSIPKPPLQGPGHASLTPASFVADAIQRPITAVEVVDRMVGALGGRDAFERLKTEHFEDERVQYTYQSWSQQGGPLEASRTRIRAWHDFEGHDLVLAQRHLPLYPYGWDLSFEEHIEAGTRGFVKGQDTATTTCLDAREWGCDRPSSRAMSAARMAMRLKEQLVSSPVLIVRELLARSNGIQSIVSGSLQGVPCERVSARWRGLEFDLTIDAGSGRLVQLETTEDDPAVGDVLYEVRYEDWRVGADGIALPRRLIHGLDGLLAQVDSIVFVEHGVPVRPAVPEFVAPAQDRRDESLGLRRSRFLLAWIGYGFPQDLSPFVFHHRFETVSPGVHLVAGEFHNSMVVELGGEKLAVVEAPLSPEASASLLASIAVRWPHATVTELVATHWHEDHVGGLRTFISKGIEIVAPEKMKSWIEQIAHHAKSLAPDGLTVHPMEPRLVSVRQRRTVEGAQRNIELFQVENVHSDGMLIVYLPREKLLYSADLYSPGLFPTHGVRGWFIRKAIGVVAPLSLLKGGTLAADLVGIVQKLGLDVQLICGGHGFGCSNGSELHVLAAYGDLAAFKAKIAH